MKNIRILFLTLLLSIGFLLPSCEKDGTSCDGVDSDAARYFDIQGIDAFMYKDTLGFDFITTTDTITFSGKVGLYLDYVAEYHAMMKLPKSTSFSLINNAWACSIIAGYDGSKTEKLVNLSIVTLNDFDEMHLANSSINDLLDYDGTYNLGDKMSLEDFLADQTENIMSETLLLQLKKVSELNREFKYKVIVELSTGEVYEAESMPVYFRD